MSASDGEDPSSNSETETVDVQKLKSEVAELESKLIVAKKDKNTGNVKLFNEQIDELNKEINKANFGQLKTDSAKNATEALRNTFIQTVNRTKERLQEVLFNETVSALGCSQEQNYETTKPLYIKVSSIDVFGKTLQTEYKRKFTNAEIKNGIWLREENRGIEIGGKTIGIIGYGNTGKALAKKLSGFGVHCIAYDKYLTNYSDQFVQEVSLNELQNRADIISIHVPLTVETKYLIDAAFLANLKTGVVILNASRGPVLQTAALIQYINNGKVAYAALDVLENEKIDQLNAAEQATFDLLCKESKVLLTSHIAGWTEASYYKIASVLAQKTIQFFTNK
jgi:hypothetical protein